MAAVRTLMKFPVEKPLAFGIIFSTFKTSGADLLVQMNIENKTLSEIDWRRNSAFALFGCFYLGGVQYAIYVKAFQRMFPKAAEYAAKPLAEKMKDPRGTVNMLSQVFIDMCIHHPLMYFPVFYSLKEVVAGGNVTDGLKKYSNNYREDLLALWKVWVPSTIINFSFMPMWGRIPWVASTSLLWSVILSTMRGRNEDDAREFLGDQVKALERMVYVSPKLDSQLTHFMCTSYGPDKVGIMHKINQTCAEYGASISESKVMRMGHYFMVMALVSVQHGQKNALLETMESRIGSHMKTSTQSVELMNISKSITAEREDSANSMMSFTVVGPDRTGICADVTQVFDDLSINIERMGTALMMKNDEVFFRMEGVITSDTLTSSSPELIQRLKDTEKSANVSIEIK